MSERFKRAIIEILNNQDEGSFDDIIPLIEQTNSVSELARILTAQTSKQTQLDIVALLHNEYTLQNCYTFVNTPGTLVRPVTQEYVVNGGNVHVSINISNDIGDDRVSSLLERVKDQFREAGTYSIDFDGDAIVFALPYDKASITWQSFEDVLMHLAEYI